MREVARQAKPDLAVGRKAALGGEIMESNLPQMAAEVLIADKAYDADGRVLEPLASAGKSAVIPPRQNRTAPRPFDEALYQARHLIENFFCRLKQFRGIATRYDKTARNFLAALHLAAATIWLI